MVYLLQEVTLDKTCTSSPKCCTYICLFLVTFSPCQK